MLSEAQQQLAGRSLNDAVRGIHHSRPCWMLVPATAAVCAILFRLLVASWPVSAMMARRRRRLAQRVAHGRGPDVVAAGTPLSLHVGEAGSTSGTSRDACLRVDAASRVLSSIHAVVAVALAVYLYFQAESGLSWKYAFVGAFGVSARRNDALLVTAGYILYDLVLCIVHKETLGDVFTLAHHAIVLASLAIGVHYGFGTFYMQVLLFAELSTLFINNRSFLLLTLDEKGWVYVANGAGAAIAFLGCRVVPSLALVSHIVWAWVELSPPCLPLSSWPALAACVLLTCLFAAFAVLNVYWFTRVLSHLLRNLARTMGQARSAHSATKDTTTTKVVHADALRRRGLASTVRA